MYLFYIKIDITVTCTIVDLEYINISPDLTLIKQHQICLYNISHVYNL